MWAGDIRVSCMQLAMLLQGVKIVTLHPNRHGSHEVDFWSLDQTNKQTNKVNFGWISKLFQIFGSMWADDIRVACMQLAMLLQGVKIDTLPPNRHGSHEVEQELVVSEAARILFHGVTTYSPSHMTKIWFTRNLLNSLLLLPFVLLAIMGETIAFCVFRYSLWWNIAKYPWLTFPPSCLCLPAGYGNTGCGVFKRGVQN